MSNRRTRYDDEGEVIPGSLRSARLKRLKLQATLREDPKSMDPDDRKLARKQTRKQKSRIEDEVSANVTRRFYERQSRQSGRVDIGSVARGLPQQPGRDSFMGMLSGADAMRGAGGMSTMGRFGRSPGGSFEERLRAKILENIKKRLQARYTQAPTHKAPK